MLYTIIIYYLYINTKTPAAHADGLPFVINSYTRQSHYCLFISQLCRQDRYNLHSNNLFKMINPVRIIPSTLHFSLRKLSTTTRETFKFPSHSFSFSSKFPHLNEDLIPGEAFLLHFPIVSSSCPTYFLH